MSKDIKKYMVIPYINSGTSAAPTWVQIKKATQLSYDPGTQTEDKDYISDEHPTTEVTDYKGSVEFDVALKSGEADFDYFYELFKSRPVGEDAKKEFLLVNVFDSSTDEETSTTKYYARKTECTIVFGAFDAVAGTLSVTINENGTATEGTVTLTDGVPTFTAD